MKIFIAYIYIKLLSSYALFFKFNYCWLPKLKLLTCIFILVSTSSIIAQKNTNWVDTSLLVNTEILLGKTLEANVDFPTTKTQKQLIFNIGRYQSTNPQEWSQRLKGPKTGYSFGITDFGNRDSLGLAFSFMPFIKFNAFKSERISILSGMGASYLTKKFDEDKNPRNQAVTTDITWAFRMYLYYQFLSSKNVDLQLGLGYTHHSNGHTRLHNKGFNSYLLSLSVDIKNHLKAVSPTDFVAEKELKKTSYNYFTARGGLGQNSFALAFNKKNYVYTFAGEYGKVYNNTFKLGIGFYYRFYKHYYDYIEGDEWMVRTGKEFDYFKSAPFYYSTNLGVSLNGEVLMNHIGVEIQVGLNLHKPAYQLEWRINSGWDNTPREIPDGWVLGEFNNVFSYKKLISGRLGLKYYVIGTEKRPKNNLYVAAHINSNLGQADFSELSLGYVYSFNFNDKVVEP